MGKHPAYLSLIEKKIINRQDYKNQRKNYVISYSLDTRNYFHIKKLFKIIKKEWGKIDCIFHFDTYLYTKPIQEFPIHNLKLIYQWNILTLFNLIKAEKIFFNSNPKYITTQILNCDHLIYYYKKGFLDYFKNHLDLQILFLKEEYFYMKFTKKTIEKTILTEKEIKSLTKKIFKKSELFFSYFDYIKYWIEKIETTIKVSL